MFEKKSRARSGTPENIQAKLPSSNKKTEIDHVKRTPFTGGGMSTKHFITGTVYGHPVSLIERALPEKNRYPLIWRAFKEVGLPVAPTLRIDAERKRVLVTDVKASGGELYGRSMLETLAKAGVPAFRRHPEIDQFFLRLTDDTHVSAISRKLLSYAEIATKHRFTLPTDDSFELLVHPDGHWELLLLDLDSGHIPPVTNSITSEELTDMNQTIVNRFLGILKRIKNRLDRLE